MRKLAAISAFLTLALAPTASAQEVFEISPQPYTRWVRQAQVVMPSPIYVNERIEGVCTGWTKPPACVERSTGLLRFSPDAFRRQPYREPQATFYHEAGHILHIYHPELQQPFVDIDPTTDVFNTWAAERFADAFRNCALGDLDYRSWGPFDKNWGEEPLWIKQAACDLFNSSERS